MFMFGFTDSTCNICCAEAGGCYEFTDPFGWNIGDRVRWEDDVIIYAISPEDATIVAGEGTIVNIIELFITYYVIEYIDDEDNTIYFVTTQDQLGRLINDWWEICDGDWIIGGGLNGPPGGLRATTGTMSLLRMVAKDNPKVGILEAKINANGNDFDEENPILVSYTLHAFKGTEEEPCNGTGTSVTFTSRGGGNWIISFNDKTFDAFSPADAPVVRLCVGNNGMVVDFEGIPGNFFICNPDRFGHWFGISSDSSDNVTEAVWDYVKYIDHDDNDVRCNQCAKSCCFSGSDNRALVGVELSIVNIGQGSDELANCNCEDIKVFIPLISDETCSCSSSNSRVLDFFQGGVRCNPIRVSFSYICNPVIPPSIVLGVGLEYLGEGADTDVSWSATIQKEGLNVDDIEGVELPLVSGPNEGFLCNFDNASVIITDVKWDVGCCGGDFDCGGPCDPNNPNCEEGCECIDLGGSTWDKATYPTEADACAIQNCDINQFCNVEDLGAQWDVTCHQCLPKVDNPLP
jgi:hypothetical protein